MSNNLISTLSELLKKGEFEEGLEQINSSSNLDIDMLILKGEMLVKLVDHRQLRILLDEIIEFHYPIDKLRQLHIQLIEIEYTIWLDNQSISPTQLEKLEDIYHEISFENDEIKEYYRARINLVYGFCWFWGIIIDGAENKVRDAIRIFNKFEDKVHLALCYNFMSDILGYGSIKGYEFQKKALQLWSEIAGPKWYSVILCRFGHANQGIGNFREALKLNLEAYEIANKVKFHSAQSSSRYCLGRINLFKGDFKEAERFFLEYSNRENLYPYEKLIASMNLGELYLHSGQFSQAFDICSQILEDEQMDESILPNFKSIDSVYLIAILASLKLERMEKAEHYLSEMRIKRPNSAYYKFCRALVLRHKSRLSDQFEAIKLLQDISKHPDLLAMDKRLVKRTLCELLLMELKLSENPEVLEEIRVNLDEITEIANTEFIFPVIIEAEILSSKLSIIEGKANESRKILENAVNLVRDKNLTLLESRLNEEIRTLNHEFSKYVTLVESNSSLKDKIAMSQIEDYFSKALKFISEEEN